MALLPTSAAAGPALPDWDAAKKKDAPALPDWDAAKKKPDGEAKKDPPALPDWEAEKAKPKPAAPAKAKKPAKKPEAEAAPETEPAEAEAAPETAATPETEATDAETTPDAATAAEAAAPPEPAVTAEAPAPAPAAPLGPSEADRLAIRRARGEMISGGVLLGLGFAGLGAMTAGVLLKRSAEQGVEEMQKGAADDLRRADSIMAVGGVVGVMTLVTGAALLGEGLRERKAARAGQVARVRVAPTLGGLVIRGRF